MERDLLEDIERALALGLPRRELARRFGRWVGGAALLTLWPRWGLAARATEADAAVGRFGAGGRQITLQVNTTRVPVFINGTPVAPSGSAGSSTTSPVVLVECDETYCYTIEPNPTGVPQSSTGGSQFQVNGTVVPSPYGPVTCDDTYCYVLHANGSTIAFPPTSFPVTTPSLPLDVNGTRVPSLSGTVAYSMVGLEIDRYCDALFCYSIHENLSGVPYQFNGTTLQFNGSPLTVNGTALNGTVLPVVRLNASSILPFPTTLPSPNGP